MDHFPVAVANSKMIAAARKLKVPKVGDFTVNIPAPRMARLLPE